MALIVLCHWVSPNVMFSVVLGSFETPTLSTVDSYMSKLDTLLQDPSTSNRDALASQVRDLVGRLEFNA